MSPNNQRRRKRVGEELFYRAFEIDRSLVDEKTRSAKLTFITETPVRRWFGEEHLLLGDKNVDLKRIKSVGAVLLNHNPDKILGRVEDAKIENRRGTATIIFDDDEMGNMAMKKVQSGSLRGVSTGYRVNSFRELMRNEEWTDPDSGKTFKGPGMVALRLEPTEITLTPVPADSNSKIGRMMTRSLDGISIERSQQIKEQEEVQAIIDTAIRGLAIPKVEDIVASVRMALKEDAKPKLAMPVERGLELASQAAAVSPECQNMVRGMILEGKTTDECLTSINKALLSRMDGGNNLQGDTGNFDGTRSAPGSGVDVSKVKDEDFAAMLRGIEDYSIA
jgi:phage head maturation protease